MKIKLYLIHLFNFLSGSLESVYLVIENILQVNVSTLSDHILTKEGLIVVANTGCTV